MSEISIPRNSFTKLLGAMRLIENCCTDCDIVGGKIRQKTNDRHSVIEIDVSGILQNNELCLSLVKQKIVSLKTFELDDNVKVDDENILLTISDTDYHFVDPISNVSLRKPLRKFLDSTFIPDDEFSKIIRTPEENLLFTHTVSAYVAKRMKGICEAFNNETVRCDIEDLTASLNIDTVNKENKACIVKNIDLNKKMPKRNFKVIYLPFALEMNSDIVLNAYQVGEDVLMIKFAQKFFDVPVTIYTQARLTDD